jgi:chromosome segregation ATPase
MRWFLAAGLCAGLLAVAFVGCGPQVQVMSDNVVAWVNSQLGELEVKKAEIEQRLADAEKGLRKLKEAKIKADVRLEGVATKIKPLEDSIDRTKASMAKLKEHINTVQQTSADVDIGGKKYDLKGLNDMAGRLLKTYKDLEAKKKAEEAGRPTLEKIAASLSKKEQEYSTSMSKLKETLTTLNNKMTEVKAIRDAAAASGDADKSINQNFNELQDKMADFNSDIEVILRREMGEFNDADKASEDIKAVDSFIDASTAEHTDPVSEIDAILGDKK